MRSSCRLRSVLWVFLAASLGCAAGGAYQGPTPVSPAVSPRGFWAQLFARGFRETFPDPERPHVDTLRPTLCWSFAPADARNVTALSYELRVAPLATLEATYVREGLTGTCHTLESDLDSEAEYVWTVRARYRLGEQWRLSEWGKIARGWADNPRQDPPGLLLYRFRTPQGSTSPPPGG